MVHLPLALASGTAAGQDCQTVSRGPPTCAALGARAAAASVAHPGLGCLRRRSSAAPARVRIDTNNVPVTLVLSILCKLSVLRRVV